MVFYWTERNIKPIIAPVTKVSRCTCGMTSNVLFRLRLFLSNFHNHIRHWGTSNMPSGYFGVPALNLDVGNSGKEVAQDENEPNQSILDSICDSVLWHAVPKSRRTLQKRRMRRFGHKRFAEAIPKNNLVPCLECGNYHESHTICGHCYERSKTEMQSMVDSMDRGKYHFDVPQSEVVYLYEGEEEERPMYEGKYIVEVKKPRPQWWPKNLLTKGHIPLPKTEDDGQS